MMTSIHAPLRLKKLSALISVLALSGCVVTGGTSSYPQTSEKRVDPPKSLTPLPPPGGFISSSREPIGGNAGKASVSKVEPPKVTAVFKPTPVNAQALSKPEGLIVAEELPTIVLGDAPPLGSESAVSSTQPLVATQNNTRPVQAEQTIVKVDSTAVEQKASDWISRFPALAKEYAEYKEVQTQLEQAYRRYEQKVIQLKKKASIIWGDDNVLEPSSDKYVKYGKGYESRGEVDFAKGNIIVETAISRDHKQRLQEAIVTTLLTPDDNRDPEMFSDQGVTFKGPSVLQGQVKDHEGKLVQWEWRANRYATWLVENKLERIPSGSRTVYRVQIPMEANHQQVRGQKYESLVRQSAQKYQVSEALIYSIMETESHFNPYATSHIPAYGLMQVVPSTAGKDVFQRIKKKSGQPSRSYLFNPANNIDTGAAYLSILDDIYLKGVTNPISREYCIISAYNGGAGNVLRTFSRDRKHAVTVINSLTPQQVYLKLNKNHPSSESRRYIEKVVQAKQRYEGMAVAQK